MRVRGVKAVDGSPAPSWAIQLVSRRGRSIEQVSQQFVRRRRGLEAPRSATAEDRPAQPPDNCHEQAYAPFPDRPGYVEHGPSVTWACALRWGFL